MTHNPTYQSWHSMIRRCTWEHHKDFPRYGAKGVKVAAAWLTYAAFLRDMGERPEGTTLDRYPDNTGDYKPGNTRWATLSQQAQNQGMQRNNRSGVKGVSWQAKQAGWLATRMLQRQRKTLYWGTDFFEAVCASKSWENRDGVGT